VKKSLSALGIAALLASTAAHADFIDQFSVTGFVNGGTDQVSATAFASYDSSAGTLTITLSNTSTAVTNIGMILDDFSFAAQDGVTFGQPTSVSASGMITCGSTNPNYTCTQSALSGYPGTANPWGIATTNDVTSKTVVAGGNTVELGAGFTGTSWSLFPWGIVNTSVLNCTGAPDCDGLGGPNPHGPYLVDATFTIPVTLAQGATFTDLTNVLFTWGTGPEVATSTSTSTGGQISTSSGPISEPNSSALTLLGVAMIGLVFMMRARSKRA